MSQRQVFNGVFVVAITCFLIMSCEAAAKRRRSPQEMDSSEESKKNPCECGIYVTGQLNGTKSVSAGEEPVLSYETDSPSLPCGTPGFKNCLSKCLDVVIKHLAKAGPLVCSALERDVHHEKAFLYVRNCDSRWTSTNFSAGKEFCCKDGEYYKCSKN